MILHGGGLIFHFFFAVKWEGNHKTFIDFNELARSCHDYLSRLSYEQLLNNQEFGGHRDLRDHLAISSPCLP